MVGPANVMTTQLEHLAAAAGSPPVTVQVAALGSRWPVLSPSFTLLGFPDEDDGPAGCYRDAAGHLHVTEHDPDVAALRNAFSALARHALTPAESLRLIHDIIQQQNGG
jgi:hypothetical protein